MEHHLVSVMDRALIEQHRQDDIHSVLAIYAQADERDEPHGKETDEKSRKGGLRKS